MEDYTDFITPELIDQFSTSTRAQKDSITRKILKQFNNKTISRLQGACADYFSAYGIDPHKNAVMEYLNRIEFPVTGKMNPQFEKLFDMYIRGLVDLSHEYLTNASLFNRDVDEFEYTVNAFEVIMDKNEIKKFFTDTTEVSEDKFFDGNKIKPAGSEDTADDTSTIYGTIEDLQNKFGKEKDNNIFSLKNVFARFQMNIKEPKAIDTVTSWISSLANNEKTAKYYTPKENNPEYYATLFDKIMKSVLQNNNKNKKDQEQGEQDDAKYKKFYNTLISEKTIDDESNRYAIVAGILKNLDSMR